MKKKLGILAILSCLSVLFLYGFGNEKIKAATEKDEPEINIFQSVSIAKYDSKTKKVSDSLKDGDNVNYDDHFKVKYQLALPKGKELNKKQSFSIEVPNFKTETNVLQEIKNKQGEILGTWEISDNSDGEKVLTYNLSDELAEFEEDQELNIEFIASLDQGKVENKDQSLIFNFRTEEKQSLILNIIQQNIGAVEIISTLEENNSKLDSSQFVKEEIDNSTQLIRDTIVRNSGENKTDTYSLKVNTLDKDDHSIGVEAMVVIYFADDLNTPLAAGRTKDGEYTFNNLTSGKYRIVGGSSSGGQYFANRGKRYVELYVPSEPAEVTIEYIRGVGGVRLHKQDIDTKKMLAGAEFKLVENMKDNTKKVIKEGLVTDENGIVEVEDLLNGDYSFIETKAPDGYILDSNPVDATIDFYDLVYPGDPVLWGGPNEVTMGNKKMGITMDNTYLPKNLDFGSHQIQNLKDETYTSNESDGSPTSGQIVINDTRNSGGWTLKVKQDAGFKNATSTVLSTETDLTIDIGKVKNSDSKLPSETKSSISLKPNTEDTIAIAQVTEATGQTTIPLDKFSLTVPKDAKKQAGQYESSLVWTLSNTPSN